VKDWYLESTRAAEYEKLTGKSILNRMRRSNPERVYRGAGAVILASVFIHFCDRILGSRSKPLRAASAISVRGG